jgi:phosphohistidine phosphatase
MKSLLLLRHAKSSWDKPGLNDMERPLNKRGKNDAPLMGKILRESGDNPHLIISSPAKRAYSTAKRVACESGYDVKAILKNGKLYMAGVEDFEDVISETDNEVKKLMIVSHNFGITDFANHISDTVINSIPTCGLVRLDFEKGFRWKDIPEAKCKMIYFKYPKMFY